MGGGGGLNNKNDVLRKKIHVPDPKGSGLFTFFFFFFCVVVRLSSCQRHYGSFRFNLNNLHVLNVIPDGFDIVVNDCYAHNGAQKKIQLIDQYG